jgi:hypothetical protein
LKEREWNDRNKEGDIQAGKYRNGRREERRYNMRNKGK